LIRQLRAYSGAPLPLPIQRVSTRVWSDEEHVIENRALYNAKYKMAEEVLGNLPGYHTPEGGFFLWLPVEDGEAAALKLWRETGVRVLPGGYLSRDVNDKNPGKGFIRVAMVAPMEEMRRGLTLIRECLYD
jgi:aspartate/methionine/tyrosine aminotransferase